MSGGSTLTPRLTPFEQETTLPADVVEAGTTLVYPTTTTVLQAKAAWAADPRPSSQIRALYLELLIRKYPGSAERPLGMGLDPECAFDAVLMYLDRKFPA